MSRRQSIFILASRSHRRRQLLEEAGYSFEIVPPAEVDELPIAIGESPPHYVARIALTKAAAVARGRHRGIVVACDTVAVCSSEVFGKPVDKSDARRMLELLRGSIHDVYSGLCLWPRPDDTLRIAVERTRLRMDRLSDGQLDDYLASGQWKGKAGGFGYQDRPGWLHILEGSESNVVGLPMERLRSMLHEWGIVP